MKSLFRMLLAGLGMLLGLIGCRSARVPMPVLEFERATPPETSLIVFLPGRHDRPERFEEQGAVKALRDAGIRADAVAADAHMGYYRNRSVITRLMEDVVKPARRQGYERIYLVGISLGGFGSLAALSEHPDEFAGVLLIAPYLGDDGVIDDVREAGNPMKWKPSEEDPSDPGEMLWTRILPMQRAGTFSRVYLAYGAEDRLAPGAAELTKLIGEDHVLVRDGGHDWATWKGLIEEITKKGMFFFGDLK